MQYTTDARKLAQPGDLLFCVRGSTTGRMNWADQQYAIGRGVAAIRHRHDLLLQPLIRGVIEFELSELLIQATGSTFPNLSARQLAEIPYPSLSETEQPAIAHVLGTLDDKIELNRRMNETLEEMARALFKSWFVDFDPVRAKMALRRHALHASEPDTGAASDTQESEWTVERARAYLDAMDPQIADLFPDRLVDSELGEIPKGWTASQLGKVANQHRCGVRPEEIDPATVYIALEHMPKHSISLADWGNAIGLASGKMRFKSGDILFGKLRPYFHKVGVAPVDGVCSTDIVVISPKSEHWLAFVLGHTSSRAFVNYTDATSTGTRMPRTKWQDMARYKLVLPCGDVARAFNDTIEPWIRSTLLSVHESRALAAQRGALLPLLMSGNLKLWN